MGLLVLVHDLALGRDVESHHLVVVVPDVSVPTGNDRRSDRLRRAVEGLGRGQGIADVRGQRTLRPYEQVDVLTREFFSECPVTVQDRQIAYRTYRDLPGNVALH